MKPVSYTPGAFLGGLDKNAETSSITLELNTRAFLREPWLLNWKTCMFYACVFASTFGVPILCGIANVNPMLMQNAFAQAAMPLYFQSPENQNWLRKCSPLQTFPRVKSLCTALSRSHKNFLIAKKNLLMLRMARVCSHSLDSPPNSKPRTTSNLSPPNCLQHY